MENNTDTLEVQLFSTSDELVINQICSILEENNIPFVRKDYGSGSYMNLYMGQSVQEKAIFVSKKDYDNCLKLISLFTSSNKSEKVEYDEDSYKAEKKFTVVRRLFGLLCLAIPIFILIILIFFA